MSYPLRINNRVAQAVAIVTFMTAYTTIIRPDLSWLIFPLTFDFILRYLHPNFSPLVRLMKFIDLSILQNKPVLYYSPPKRFAILVGIIVTSGISLSIVLEFLFLQYLLTGILLIACFLQGFFDYCIGCKLYDVLIKLGLFGDYHNISLTY